ncbi:hypothetical protein [Anatilimnocola floriformis]|uniref:hypothetical protein n=1 Tax=Anatilimnocola floriformis TaxID=2948575 RepID=UPI0020C46C1B|nr:hypothetical protein [Anatilimnocola floriformis]
MSTISASELQQFALFIQAKLQAGEGHLSPEDALDQWRDDHPSDGEFAENVRAIQVALDQLDAGERGISAAESVQRLRDRARTPRT